MKYIVIVLLSIFFITGCSTKKEVVINVNEQKQEEELRQAKILKQKVEQEQLNNEILTAQEEISMIDDLKEPVLQDELVFDKEMKMDIALIFPSKLIGKYAKSSINTVTGYFLYKKMNFNLQVFDSELESAQNITETFEELKASGIKKVIALYTINAVDIINSIEGLDDLEIYFPLIHKEELVNPNERFIYGGISYEDQMLELMNLSNFDNYMFYQNTYVGQKLKKYYEELTLEDRIVQVIQRKNNNFKAIISDAKLDDKTIFLNTSIVKTSILLSQFTVYNKEPYIILSTQLNYNPLLISLTQKDDRTQFFVANSIDDVDPILSDIIYNLGANVVFNWVDYSTLVGVNYLYDLNNSNTIKTKINENQVQYEPRIYTATSSGFLEIK